ncbi:MAG: peptidylprolyl isomerase [Bacillota bacterium]|nr:peptidylprolyl isomerase [Bacillota bacterium]
MKKAKLSLGLIAVLAGGIALSACDVTAKDGVILSFTTKVNGESVTVDYTASELFGYYSNGTDAASASFDAVYEVLIRHYYEYLSENGYSGVLTEINRKAENEVNSLKQQAANNANSNGTSYAVEWESILEDNGCENVDELFSHCQYEIEKDQFETDYYDDNLEGIRDGGDEYVNGTSTGRKVFATVEDPTQTDDNGYLKEKVPYHVSHILAQIDGDTSVTQAEISEADANQISQIVEALASGTRTFEALANNTSLNDDSSASEYGDLGIMDKDTEYVPEFKLGTYAFDAIYNGQTTSSEEGSYRQTQASEILPDTDTTYGNGSESVINYFKNKEIGVIPYGAAVALANSADITSANGVNVCNGDASFYPRNILFNKYFNHRNICVIVPTDIPYNVVTSVSAENYSSLTSGTVVDGASTGITGSNDVGLAGSTETFGTETTYNTNTETYKALAGFQTDTTDIIDFSTFDESDPRSTLVNSDGSSLNCLTDTKGRIILAVRAASDSYNGVHFIMVDRSGLVEYADVNGTEITEDYYEANSATSNITSLSDYYTINYVGQTGYPTYTSGTSTRSKTTYNNYITRDDDSMISRAESLQNTIKNYNSNISTYIYESLLAGSGTGGTSLQFSSNATRYKNLIDTYITVQREDTVTDENKEFNDAWADYAEELTYSDEVRSIGDENGMGYLLSEVVAIGYTSQDSVSQTSGTIYSQGGAGYAN